MPNVRDDDEETLDFADESDWMDNDEDSELDDDSCHCMAGVGPHPYHGTPRP